MRAAGGGARASSAAGATPGASLRLQVFLARAGRGSRRAMEAAIQAGRVQVDGVVVSRLGSKVDPAAQTVTLDGLTVRTPRQQRLVIALHKPRGVLTTVHDPSGRPTVIELLPTHLRSRRLYPIGRLDLESEGLVLLTDDGPLAHRVMHPRFGHEREYQVEFSGRPPHDLAAQFASGLEIGERSPARAELRRLAPSPDGGRATLVLHEGRKRQIRRMFAALGLQVDRLRRTRIGTLRLGNLAPGEYRRLTPSESGRLLGTSAADSAAASQD